MALVNFKKGTQADYDGNVSAYSSYIYAAEDTRNVYIFGVLQQGISDEDFAKLDAFDTSVLSVINAQKNIANGIAGLDSDGKIPVSLLNGQYARVHGIDEVATSSTLPNNPTLTDEGNYEVWCTDDKKIRSWDGSEWSVIDPAGDTIYNFRNEDVDGNAERKNILYRWDGTTMVEISASLALGEVSGTAYEGSKGAANRAALDSMMELVITGFGSVTANATQITIPYTNASKAEGTNIYSEGDGGNFVIPAATSSTAGLMSAADKAALDTLRGSGEGSLSDLSDKVTQVTNDLDTLEAAVGSNSDLTTDAKTTIVAAINEVDSHADAAQAAAQAAQGDVDALEAVVVKQVKVGSNGALNPVEGLITIANATTSADGAMAKEDKAKVDKIVDSGDGSQFLANDGTYKTIEMELSDDYAASTEVNEALEPKAGDSYETAIGKLHKAILDNEEVVAQAFVNFQTVLGVENPNMTMPDLSDTNYLSGQTQFVAALKALDSALKTVADQAATITDLTSRVAALEAALTLKSVE